jgi:multidrug efflux pump subunit AcrB
MLIGTVVNNGILFVDTANQYRETMDMDTALIEAGATRIRPILMTTLTTIISMIPMAMAIGNSGNMTQGLAIVNIGGLTASTVMCLLMLPGYYKLMSGNRKIIKEKRGGGRKPWPVIAGSFKKNLKRNRKDKGRSEE